MNKCAFLLWTVLLCSVLRVAAAPADPAKWSNVQYAQSVFTAMAEGDQNVQQYIDWYNLKTPNVDVGVEYRKMPNDTERAAFRKGFVESFSRSFKGTGASAESLTGWRQVSDNAKLAVVSAVSVRYPHRGLALTFAKVNKVRYLVSVQPVSR